MASLFLFSLNIDNVYRIAEKIVKQIALERNRKVYPRNTRI